MPLGRLGRLGKIGQLGSPGGKGRPGAGASAPVLSLISVVGGTATFAIDVDATVGAGDVVRLQIAVSGTAFGSIVSDTTHTITAPEDAANEIDLSLSLVNGNYDARTLITHAGIDSAWSNTVSFTVTGSTLTGRLMWSTDQQLWSTDHLVWA